MDLEPEATTSRVRISLDSEGHIPIHQVTIASTDDKDYNVKETNFGLG